MKIEWGVYKNSPVQCGTDTRRNEEVTQQEEYAG